MQQNQIQDSLQLRRVAIDTYKEKKAEPPHFKAARLSNRPVAFRPFLSTGLALSYGLIIC